MEEIIARAQDGGEIAAGAVVDIAQEGLRLRIAEGPVVRDHDLAPVLKLEAGDVDGIAEGVLGEGAEPRFAIDAAAAIGAKGCGSRRRAR